MIFCSIFLETFRNSFSVSEKTKWHSVSIKCLSENDLASMMSLKSFYFIFSYTPSTKLTKLNFLFSFLQLHLYVQNCTFNINECKYTGWTIVAYLKKHKNS